MIMVMREMALPQILILEKQQNELGLLCKRRKGWLVSFFISSVTGAGAGLTGLILCALETLGLSRSPRFDIAATWMVVAAFLLFILAAHCLDRAAATERAIKAITYNEQQK